MIPYCYNYVHLCATVFARPNKWRYMHIRVEVCRYVQAVNVHVQYVMLYDMIVIGVTMSDTMHVTVYVYRCYCDV